MLVHERKCLVGTGNVSNLCYLGFLTTSFLNIKDPVVFIEPGPGILEQCPSTHSHSDTYEVLTVVLSVVTTYDKRVLFCFVFSFSGMRGSGKFL